MKTIVTKLILVLAATTLGLVAAAQQQNGPAEENPATPPNNGTDTNAQDPQEMVGQLIQAVVDAQQDVDGDEGTNTPALPGAPRSIRGQGARGTTGSSSNAVSLAALVAKQPNTPGSSTTNLLRLNFRNAPLSLVLDYLSEAAGFVISANSKVDLKGTITVWSNQPVTRHQAAEILNKALNEHNYAANVEGNVLNIHVVDSSNTEIIPGVPENDYTTIPPTGELVTQIVYVRNVEAGQLITSLQPLMPSGTSMTANQGANAIILTDTKANIRRMVQLVKALDTASVSASGIEVFPLQYADATTLAQVVQQLFQTDVGSNNRGGGNFPGFFGRFGPGGDRGGGGGGGGSSAQAGRVAAAKVTAVADDRSNSLVVSASEDQMKVVRQLVAQMDVNVADITELRVFRLKHADPQETADQLTSLFPDPTTQQTSGGRGGFRGMMFGGPPGFNPGGNNNANQNSRKVLQAKVTAVADPRTSSVIVSASRDLMPQISGIIEELDSDPAKKKKVYVIKVENRDPEEVVQDLQSVIATDTSSGNFNTRSSSQQRSGSQLSTRQQNNLRNSGNNSSFSGFNSTGSRTGR